jgi:Xaa-Pro aminopeptidase
MINTRIHAERRAVLSKTVAAPILLMGNGNRSRNLPMSPLPFRQDSTFLYFTGCTRPGAALLLVDGETTLFLPKPADDDALWHGHAETLSDMAGEVGISRFADIETLDTVAKTMNTLATIAVPDLAQTQRAARLSGGSLTFGEGLGHTGLIDAIIQMRRTLSDEEINEMRVTARVTNKAHRAAMAATRPGAHERDVAAAFENVVARAGLTTAYPSIVTVRGEILHNFHYVNPLREGQLLLLDGGAEAASGYATDVTRTWPVNGRFNPRQRAAYDAVLEAQLQGIERVRAGVRYREVHTRASLIIARFLVDEGLVFGTPEDAVETGAHAIFFPHGIGHLIGLDVHDLENFGDRAAYAPGRARSTQFGTGYLRLDLDLEPGMVVTVEPGFYVVPAILHDQQLRARFAKQVNFDAAEKWIGFGGIRIEDDVVVTAGDPEVLSGAIPKTPDALMSCVGANGE